MTAEPARRPRGLPIGNSTSQFWSNCTLHPFDLKVIDERVVAYLLGPLPGEGQRGTV